MALSPEMATRGEPPSLATGVKIFVSAHVSVAGFRVNMYPDESMMTSPDTSMLRPKKLPPDDAVSIV
jgi:hypothetical protein